jgi:tellurite resistance protein TerC
VDVSVVGWAATIAGLVVIFGLDILLMGRRPRVVGMREAALSVVGYVALAALFGVGVWLVAGDRYSNEYFAGYITELSLSVDNLFVFVVIMTSFAVPLAGPAEGAAARHHRHTRAARAVHRRRRSTAWSTG